MLVVCGLWLGRLQSYWQHMHAAAAGQARQHLQLSVPNVHWAVSSSSPVTYTACAPACRLAYLVAVPAATPRCDEVVCSSTEPLADRVKAITGGTGAGSVLDCVGGELSEQLAAAVRSGGTVWLYGLMEGLSFKGHGAECLFRWAVTTDRDKSTTLARCCYGQLWVCGQCICLRGAGLRL